MPRTFLRRALVAATAVAASALTLSSTAAQAAPLSAAPSAAGYSNNWAGYTAHPKASILGVTTEFTVPSASCKNSLGSKGPYWGAMWAGIGGTTSKSWLEQDGVTAYCSSKSSQAKYYAWWESVPPTPSSGGMQGFGTNGTLTQVYAKDKIFLQVLPPQQSSKPGEWSFQVIDQTRDTGWTKFLKLPANAYADTGNTAEVITEDPVIPGSTHTEPFVDLGQVNYSYADYFTSAANGDGLEINAVTQHRVDMYRSGTLSGLILMIYPTSPPTTSPDSAVTGDAFSTKYTSYWKI